MRRRLLIAALCGWCGGGVCSCGSSDEQRAAQQPVQDASGQEAAPDGGAGDSAGDGDAGSPADAGEAEAGVGCPAALPDAVKVDNNGKTSWLQVQGDPAGSEIGIFDPSVRKASDGTFVMSYSSVNLQRNRIHTRIAVSTDGTTFTSAAKANQPQENVDVPVANDPDCPSGTCVGARIDHETSALVEDAADPDPNARWKVFTHQYVVLQDPLNPDTPILKYNYGYLAVVKAPAPAGPWSSPAPVIGWPSNAPLSSTAPTLVASIDAIKDCVVLSEPSALVDAAGSLELAVGCVFMNGSVASIRIELLRSGDHGTTWSYGHRLLEASDGECVGGAVPQLNAAHLFDRGGQRWLIATPAGEVTFPGGGKGTGYRGCLVFKRTTDGIERDVSGAPVVYGRIDPGGGVFNGACSDMPAGGYVLSALSDQAPSLFRMYGPIGVSLP